MLKTLSGKKAMYQKKRIIFFIINIFLLLHTASVAEMRSTNGENVTLHTGPNENNSVKCEYGNGFPLEVITQKGKWTQVHDFENDSGWVKTSLLSSNPHVVVKVNKGKNKKINIRKGPGPQYDIAGQAYYGVVFEKKEQKNGWLKVKHESGLEGWIDKSLVWGY